MKHGFSQVYNRFTKPNRLPQNVVSGDMHLAMTLFTDLIVCCGADVKCLIRCDDLLQTVFSYALATAAVYSKAVKMQFKPWMRISWISNLQILLCKTWHFCNKNRQATNVDDFIQLVGNWYWPQCNCLICTLCTERNTCMQCKN